jgi:heavy metal sensor kinase
MKPVPLRVKLTAWYSAVFLAAFALFGAVAYYAMRASINTTVDEALHDQISGVEKLMGRILPEGTERLEDELRENFEVRRGADFSQIADEQGRWIYRSPLMKRYGVSLPKTARSRITALEVSGLPLRALTTSIQVDGKTFRVQIAAPMDDFEEALESFRWVLLLSSPLLLVLASLGGYWMSRRALTPVDEITRAAQNISSHNLSSRLAVPETRDELQRLSETLNGMLARLEAAFKRITQFTADASHELRTPVALMRTTAELSLRKPRSRGEYRQALAHILNELEKTSSLIERLMLLARADSGYETLRRVQLNLNDLFREVCKEGRTLAEAKGINFSERVDNTPVGVAGDSQALQRLFLILMDNAVKYTPPGGQIAASLISSDGFAVAEIRDSGIGIGEADLPHIFERFYRADKARSHEEGGAGLGLSIGRWIAEVHGGAIEVESPTGQGSLFRVRIPLASPDSPA